MVSPSLIAPYLPFLLPAGIVAATIIAWWAAVLPRLSVSLLLLSLVAGQVIRFPLPGQGGGILVSDIGVALVLINAAFTYFRTTQLSKFQISNFKFQNNKLPITNYQLLITPFILWSLFTLIIQVPELGLPASLVSFSYWLRLAAHLLLLPALLLVCREQKTRHFLERGFVVVITTLILLGFAQLVFFPNLWDLSRVAPLISGAKWDPHQSRLTSTWLDPNFFGAFLVIVLPFLLARKVSLRLSSYFLMFVVMAALALTQSRSSLIALVGTTALISPLWLLRQRLQVGQAMRYVSVVGFFVVALILAGFLLGERFVSLWQYDPTVDLRTQSLRLVWHELVQPNAFLGVGYNAYQFAALKAGLIQDFSLHSRAGADNSWLTLWVTTGVLGVVLFAAPWVYLAVHFIARWFKGQHALSLAAAFSLLALFIHSQFLNSFLYSHLLITLVIIVTLALRGDDVLKREGLVISN